MMRTAFDLSYKTGSAQRLCACHLHIELLVIADAVDAGGIFRSRLPAAENVESLTETDAERRQAVKAVDEVITGAEVQAAGPVIGQDKGLAAEKGIVQRRRLRQTVQVIELGGNGEIPDR
jgi:hypothetical protein